MHVEDVYIQGRRLWVRLHEKGGKEHTLPCHHELEEYLQAYINAAGMADEKGTPLFRSAMRRTGRLTETCLHRIDAFRMVKRRREATLSQNTPPTPDSRPWRYYSLLAMNSS